MQELPEVSLELLDAMGIAVFEPAGSGRILLTGRRPEWLETLPPGPTPVEDSFPFLSGFLIAAEAFWEGGSGGALRSDIWEQTSYAAGQDEQCVALRCSAVAPGGRRLLLMERLEAEYEEYRGALQRSREKSLDNERLERMAKVLSLARDEAANAVRDKSESLAGIGHDLRTPLNAMLGFATLLLQERAGPLNERQRSYLDQVTKASRRLRGLIDDVLDLSKIEAGILRLNLEEFVFEDELNEVLEMMRPLAQAKDLLLRRVQETGNPQTVLADRARVRQILYNLIGNAIKFTGGGLVEVACEKTAGFLEVCISDTGAGIAGSEQKLVFGRFYQTPSEHASEGTGLGLAISRRLVEQHGGVLRVESSPGAGSRFYFTIPLAHGELAHAAVLP